MKKTEIAIGEKFSRLTVISSSEIKNGRSYFLTKCDCGAEKLVIGTRLKAGRVKSCGCLWQEARVNNGIASSTRLIASSTTHGKRKSREYSIWIGMVDRCNRTTHHAWKRYGGRGIKVDESWLKFENFYHDMAPAPEGFQLDRVDNNLGYSKENCRWVHPKQNCRNTRRNRMVSFNGELITLAEAAEKSRLSYGLLWARVKRGCEDLFSPKKNQRKSKK